VHEIYRWYRDGHRVIAVVSAIGDATDLLLASARDLASEPEPYALAELLATGERAAAALLGVALDRVGVRARVVDPRTIGLLALGSVLDSEPVGVNREQLKSLLTEFPVLLVPGFFGYDEKKRLHLLGRGGSDLTAAFLASAVRRDALPAHQGCRRCV
jgi:homoserine dehydrogenase